MITKFTAMHIAYSAFNNNITNHQEIIDDPVTKLRYQAYQQVCEKHKTEIAKIQQYIPGWFPQFNNNTNQ